MSFDDSGKKPVTVGPWGGSGGSRWDDGIYSTVRQLVIAYGAGIDSIKIEYDQKGCSIWSDKHGGSGGLKTDKVKLDYPDEYLTSVHGYYGSLNQWGTTFVRSLSFESNKKKYGPFGVEEGTYFSFPMTGGKIVGFHGRCGWYLDAIGVYLKPLQQQNPSSGLHHSQNYQVNTINPSQNHLANTSEHVGYSIIQGSMGESFDIVLAVRQKDGFGKPIPNNFPAPPKITEIKEPEHTKHHKKKVPIPVKYNKEKVPDTIKDYKEKVLSPIRDHREKVPDPIKDHKEKIAREDKVPSNVEEVVTYGPWGGNGGSIFDDGAYTGIRQVNLSRNVGIVWIRVLYDQNGEAIWGSKQGGTGGFKTDKIVLDFPWEVLTHISGYYGPLMYMGPSTIRSLTFHTTKGLYGPFGDEQGTHFTTKLKGGKVVGIHGRKGLFLDAIGVHVIEGKVIPPASSTPPCNAIVPREPSIAELENALPGKLVLAKQAPLEEVSYGVVKEPAPCGPGPWGGDGGRPWDDGVFSGIKQIYLTRVAEAVCSIQIEYDRNGQSVWSVKHGSNGGETMHRIKLEYPHEVLSCVSGYYGPIAKDERQVVIKSLTFFTSRGKYGPYGEEVGKFFTSTTTEGKVVGFHGKSSLYLDAIGVHMQHWLGNQKTSKSSLFKLF
ncbi:hypothetical protein QN277_018281 [Acacia crassicarpa]|uniref:Mannose/glucose-specific lectin n=1 Tax=Acacia crassicarpa TaxID=499986 RepID=A0AAE1JT34_9FABA|nr:hypothetical protein QN277_018281 [Acacia crassicarpa]